MTPATALARWADLPFRVLYYISRHLRDEADYVRFHAVCKAWRATLPPAPPSARSSPRRRRRWPPGGSLRQFDVEMGGQGDGHHYPDLKAGRVLFFFAIVDCLTSIEFYTLFLFPR
jgi:hypothetical protein